MRSAKAFPSVFVLIVMASLATSCDWFLAPDDPIGPCPSAEWDSIPNAIPADRGDEALPLFAGARTILRNATADFNPEVHPGGLIERHVLGVVQLRTGSDYVARDCYVYMIRDAIGPKIRLYLRRSGDGIEIYGIETIPYAGLPEFLPCDGQPLFSLPFADGEATSVSLSGGTSFDSEILRLEIVPRSSTHEDYSGLYSSGTVWAWRVISEYGGALAETLGSGDEETWYAPGVGLVRRTSRSYLYELIDYVPWDQATHLHEDSRSGPYRLPVEDVVVIQLRGSEPAGIGWELTNASDIAQAGVLVPLPEYGLTGLFLADIDDEGRLETGTHAYAFEVRTTGSETLVFERSGASVLSETITFAFGESLDPILSDPSVAVSTPIGEPATVTFSVHYSDADGTPPTVSQVCIDGGVCYEMQFESGKLADGTYRSNAIEISQGQHTYCFRFGDVSDANPDDVSCQLTTVFDVGGPVP